MSLHSFGYPVPYKDMMVDHRHKFILDLSGDPVTILRWRLGGNQRYFFRFYRTRFFSRPYSRPMITEYIRPWRTARAVFLALLTVGLALGRWRDSTVDEFDFGSDRTGWVDEVQLHIARGMRSTYGSRDEDTAYRAGSEHLLGGLQNAPEWEREVHEG